MGLGILTPSRALGTSLFFLHLAALFWQTNLVTLQHAFFVPRCQIQMALVCLGLFFRQSRFVRTDICLVSTPHNGATPAVLVPIAWVQTVQEVYVSRVCVCVHCPLDCSSLDYVQVAENSCQVADVAFWVVALPPNKVSLIVLTYTMCSPLRPLVQAGHFNRPGASSVEYLGNLSVVYSRLPS